MTFILRDAALSFINTWFFQIILSLMEIRQTIIKKHPDFVIRKIPIYNLLTNNVLYPFLSPRGLVYLIGVLVYPDIITSDKFSIECVAPVPVHIVISEVTHVLRTMVFVLFAWLFFTDGRRSEWLYLFPKSHLYLGLLCFFFLVFLLLGCKSCGKGQQKSQQKEHPPVHDVSLLSSGYVCCSHGFCLFVLG